MLKLSHLSLLIINYEDALTFYKKIGFKVHIDSLMKDGQRWLTLCTPTDPGFELCLLQVLTEDDKNLVGKQGGSFPFFSLETDNAKKLHSDLSSKSISVTLLEEFPWGIGFTIHDLYGNKIYINQPK